MPGPAGGPYALVPTDRSRKRIGQAAAIVITIFATSGNRNIMNRQRPLILLLLTAFIFAPMLFEWSTDAQNTWYKPFIIWLLVIVLAYCLVKRKSNHDL